LSASLTVSLFEGSSCRPFSSRSVSWATSFRSSAPAYHRDKINKYIVVKTKNSICKTLDDEIKLHINIMHFRQTTNILTLEPLITVARSLVGWLTSTSLSTTLPVRLSVSYWRKRQSPSKWGSRDMTWERNVVKYWHLMRRKVINRRHNTTRTTKSHN
jgi:hypothetical protein